MSPGHKRFTPSAIQRLREFHAPNIEVAHADAFRVLEALIKCRKMTLQIGRRGPLYIGVYESPTKNGWKILISYNNDQKVIDAFPNFGVDEVDWTYVMKSKR